MRVLITVLGTARAKQLDEVSIELQDSNGVTPPIKVTELNPSFAAGNGRRFLIIDCPHCRRHPIAIQVAGEEQFVWEQTGDLENITLMPSVAKLPDREHAEQQFIYGAERDCRFHFWIRGGYAFLVS